MIQPLDWSATAAWIALIISVAGTVIGPIVTAVLTNRHQLKIYKLESKQKEYDDKINSIRNCISGIGSVLANPSADNLAFFGKSFPIAYSFLPQEKWNLLDEFFLAITRSQFPFAKELSPEIIHLLNDLLTEQSQ